MAVPLTPALSQRARGTRSALRATFTVIAPVRAQSYWHQPEATQQAFDGRGWLHSGDVAGIEDGYSCLPGRLKPILVTSSGEKIPPGDVAMALTLDPLIEQALVVGEGRPYVGTPPGRWGRS